MKILGDYHTHSTYSKFKHGKNTIDEMVESAKAKGLNFLAITDHGPKHIAFGIKRKNIDRARFEIDEINKLGKIKKVYFGIEANLIGKDGTIDLTQQEIDKLDLLIVGYHRGTFNNIINPFGLFSKSKKQVEKQTQAYINLVNKYDVDFITHLCEYIQVDVKRVAEECAKTDTVLEINNRHYRWTDEQMQQILETDVKFIISSDAHKRSRIAFVDDAMEVVKKFKIPPERIVNYNKDYVPKKFRRAKEEI